ncbi:hypothetical protein BDB01DRAFT_896786 [Pilobolus umbonatus]|nr:hypothetical protein BDB01DRAFT_896786 [Pilobolus umbonatus]
MSRFRVLHANQLHHETLDVATTVSLSEWGTHRDTIPNTPDKHSIHVENHRGSRLFICPFRRVFSAFKSDGLQLPDCHYHIMGINRSRCHSFRRLLLLTLMGIRGLVNGVGY